MFGKKNQQQQSQQNSTAKAELTAGQRAAMARRANIGNNLAQKTNAHIVSKWGK